MDDEPFCPLFGITKKEVAALSSDTLSWIARMVSAAALTHPNAVILSIVERVGLNEFLYAVNAENDRRKYVAGTLKLQPYQERVVAEQEELLTRINKLHAFLDSELCKKLSAEEISLLTDQLTHMGRYYAVLRVRMAAFRKAPKVS